MNKEYEKNQNAQRKSFRKYRKYIGKILLWGAVAVASAFIIPYGGMFSALKGLVGESIAMNATFLTQWGLTAGGVIGSLVNAVKANRERKKIDDAQDEEENIIDGMVNENDDLKRKVDSFEKAKTKSLVENKKVKQLDEKENVKHTIQNEVDKDKGKQYVR